MSDDRALLILSTEEQCKFKNEYAYDDKLQAISPHFSRLADTGISRGALLDGVCFMTQFLLHDDFGTRRRRRPALNYSLSPASRRGQTLHADVDAKRRRRCFGISASACLSVLMQDAGAWARNTSFSAK